MVTEVDPHVLEELVSLILIVDVDVLRNAPAFYTLIAKYMPVGECSALLTIPHAPFPSTLISYSSVVSGYNKVVGLDVDLVALLGVDDSLAVNNDFLARKGDPACIPMRSL